MMNNSQGASSFFSGLSTLLGRPHPLLHNLSDTTYGGAAEHIAGSNLQGVGSDDRLLQFSEKDIVLMPDWELVLKERHRPEVRGSWGWMLLPARFGFPVADSPGAGAANGIDVGQYSPLGPNYQGAWGRTGEAPGFAEYLPRIGGRGTLLRWFSNRLGFLNIVSLGIAVVPGIDYVTGLIVEVPNPRFWGACSGTLYLGCNRRTLRFDPATSE